MDRIVTCILVSATFKVVLAGVTAGNDGTRGGNYKFGSAPNRISRGGSSPAEDGHPVHGITCQYAALQGKIFQAGKCVGNVESTPLNHACGVLFNADGTVAWSWIPTPSYNQGSVASNTDEYMTAVAEAPDGSYLLAFGHVNQHRTMYKISPTGATIFEYRWTDFSNSAFEFGFFGTDGNVYAVGFKNAESGGTWYFKSSGVVDGGHAFWQKITAAEIAANSLPAATVQVFEDFAAFRHFAKAAQGFVAVGPTGSEGSSVGIMKLNEDGTQDWSTDCTACGHQFTGVSTGQGGTTFYVSGHGSGDGSETDRSSSASVSFGLDGKVSHFNSLGVHQWTKRYPTPAASVTKIPASDMRVVFEECWSIDATSDGGAVVGCGAGTHCGEAPSDWLSKCNAADMETWQSMIFKISADGTLVWLRIDAEPHSAATGPENAAEYASVNPDGTILITHDDTMGMGFATFGPGDEVVAPADDASSDTEDNDTEDDNTEDDSGSGLTDGAPTRSLSLTLVVAVSAALLHRSHEN